MSLCDINIIYSPIWSFGSYSYYSPSWIFPFTFLIIMWVIKFLRRWKSSRTYIKNINKKFINYSIESMCIHLLNIQSHYYIGIFYFGIYDKFVGMETIKFLWFQSSFFIPYDDKFVLKRIIITDIIQYWVSSPLIIA